MKWIAFAAVFCWACAAQAAVIHIKPAMVTVYDGQFNDVTSTAVDLNENGQVRLRPSDEPYTMQVDFSFTISNLQTGQIGFGNAAFNINLGGAFIQSSVAPGWNPDHRWFPTHGPAPHGVVNFWADNGDYGRFGDLQSTIIGTDPPDFLPVGYDPRRVVGQNGDEYFGNAFFELPSNLGTAGHLRIEADGGSVYNANNKLVTDGVTVIGGSIEFQVVPEPRSAILLGLGGTLLAGFGRRFRR